ncbi:MAG: hypothetical protein OEW67_14065 [Cyclobacteriaceae bacterium]|nr:hypothetical protein [Cyclobacteriaceae bacterium]
MKKYLLHILLITGIACIPKKEVVIIPFNKIGLFVDANDSIHQDLLNDGTYQIDEGSEIITYPLVSDAEEFFFHFTTKDDEILKGFCEIRYVLDTTNLIKMHKTYGTGYYEMYYLPKVKQQLRNTAKNYTRDSLEECYSKFRSKLLANIDSEISREFFILIEFKIDSVAEIIEMNPFKK